jgi:hypothetical protein
LLFMRRLAKPARIIGLLSVAVALCACSAVKLGYNALPQAGAWWLDRYVDFSDEQEQRLREDLARLHQWHRNDELPRLAELLQRLERLAAGDVSPAQACALVPAIRSRLLAVAEQAEPAATTLALTLDAAQLAHLERKFEKNKRDFRKDWVALPPAGQQEKRFEQFLERSETIYGPLDAAQRDGLRRLVERSVFDAATSLAERQRRQQDILQALRQLAGQPLSLAQARALVHGVVERAMQSPDPRHRAYQEALVQEGCRNFSVLHNSTSAQQREHAARRIRAYERELRELASQR